MAGAIAEVMVPLGPRRITREDEGEIWGLAGGFEDGGDGLIGVEGAGVTFTSVDTGLDGQLLSEITKV